MVTKKKTIKSKPKAKTSTPKSKPSQALKGKVINQKYKYLKLDKSYTTIFLIISIFFLIVGASRIILENETILGIQFLITAVLFSKAYRKLSEKKISIDSKNIKDKTFFIIGFVFSIIGLSMGIRIWVVGIALFSIWLFSKK